MRLHELPLVCARLTCASDLETWASMATFVVRARGLQSLVICQCEGVMHCGDDGGGGDGHTAEERIMLAGVDGAGAEECARAAASCLRMRGGALETIVWGREGGGWRL
jgi:hypothetical protein